MTKFMFYQTGLFFNLFQFHPLISAFGTIPTPTTVGAGITQAPVLGEQRRLSAPSRLSAG